MTATEPALGSRRIVELDGLRGIAVLLVLAHHLWPIPRVGIWTPPLGHVGVSLFFVLSGFLITGLLLDARGRLAEGGSLRGEFGRFYLRRLLRIVPPYALLLIAFWVIDVHASRERWLWHATYLSNWHLAIDDELRNQGYDRHLWSLSVEEQFYLVWPALMLLLPRRLLTPAVLLVFALSPAWRAWFWLGSWHPAMSELPTPANMDLLAAGALLALWRGRRAFNWLITVGLITLPITVVAHGPLENFLLDWRIAFNRSLLAFSLVGIVGLAASRSVGLLRFPPLIGVGIISYAAYLVHTVSGPSARWLLGGFDNPWLVGFVSTSLTLLVATGSWFALERPLLQLRKRLR
ncbi:MAG: acyltransferase [Planctomycetota bacterium]